MIQTFERNKNTKSALQIGLAKKLPELMKDSGWDYNDYYDVWRWAIAEEQNYVFPYIVSLRGTKWINGETIMVGMGDNNGLLWESVSSNWYPAVKALLEVPGLFSEEVLTMRYGTSQLKETFMRGDSVRHYRGTNFAQYLSLAMKLAKGNFEIQDALKEYYEKEKCSLKEAKA